MKTNGKLRFRHVATDAENSCLGFDRSVKGSRRRDGLAYPHTTTTYLHRIRQKQPKLLPFGTSPAYDMVMSKNLTTMKLLFIKTHTRFVGADLKGNTRGEINTF